MKFIVAATFANTLAATAFSVDQNLVTIAGVLVTTIAVVLTTISWIDKRISSQVKSNAQLFNMQLNLVLQEIRHLKAFLGYKEAPNEGSTMPLPPEGTGDNE